MEETWKGKGLICLSDRWSNPVMWSHYTDSHKGLVLGFDVHVDKVFPVQYKSTRERLKQLAEIVREKDGKSLENAVLIKYSHWRYEHEWRMLLKLGEKQSGDDHYFEPFSNALTLREVIIGERSNASSSQIKEIVDRAVVVLTARLAFGTFRVVEQLNGKYKK